MSIFLKTLASWPSYDAIEAPQQGMCSCTICTLVIWFRRRKSPIQKKKYSDVNLNFFFENHDFSDIFAGPNFLPILNFWSPKIRQNLAIHFFGKSWNFWSKIKTSYLLQVLKIMSLRALHQKCKWCVHFMKKEGGKWVLGACNFKAYFVVL